MKRDRRLQRPSRETSDRIRKLARLLGGARSAGLLPSNGEDRYSLAELTDVTFRGKTWRVVFPTFFRIYR